MTKQINLDPRDTVAQPRTKFVRVRASWHDRLIALAAALTFLVLIGIVTGSALWVLLKVWSGVVSMM